LANTALMNDRIVIFQQHTPRLYGIAYRMLGSRADVEDVIQDAYLRWHQAHIEDVRTPQAWLVTTVTRLCIDRLRAARVEREAYAGPWLPEPLLTGDAMSPDYGAELASDLSIAFLLLLERLAPEERAAFLLHDIFDCEYGEIARILGKSEVACRQMVHRAGRRVRRERPRFAASESDRMALLNQFVAAVNAHDQDALLALFAEDATWTSDGGGKVVAARRVVRGAERLVRFVLGIANHFEKAMYELAPINGEMGLIIRLDGRLHSLLSIDTDGKRILAVYIVLNPQKLRQTAFPELHDTREHHAVTGGCGGRLES
jgi:RNA polymerase sigma-70 factor, ECF subfamily